MDIYTIGFTKHSAESFFGTLEQEGIKHLIDVRLQNTSHLAGFAKQDPSNGHDNLEFFLDRICGTQYSHMPELLAPTKELFKSYKGKEIDWDQYEGRFLNLLSQRKIEDNLDPALFNQPTVLLCTEHTPDKCHRRLIVEYLNNQWHADICAIHLPRPLAENAK